MNNTEFVKKVKAVATDFKTLYVMGCFGAPMTASNKARYCQHTDYNQQASRQRMINAASADTFGFDCVCLIKGILWGWNGNKNATYGGATIEDFVSLLSGIRTVGYAFTLALTVLAVFLIYNTIQITINTRKQELGIMRLCGANNSYITAPLVLEGIFIGIMGSVVPILLTIFGYRYIYERMNGQLVSGILKLIPVYPFVYYVSAFALAIGVTVGLIGSMLSANKYLRWKR